MNTTQLREKLESETGFLCWQELEKHFAQGVLRVISSDANLIDLATDIAQNNADQISTALSKNHVSEPSDLQAKKWQKYNSRFLCVVTAPFVLIQENDPAKT